MVDLSSNFQFLLGHCIRSIERGDSRELKRYLRRYENIVDRFINITKFDKSFDHSTADSIARSINQDFQLLSGQAVQAPIQEFPRQVLNSQGTLMRNTVSSGNQIVAKEFSTSFADSYEIAVRSGADSDKFIDDLMRNFARPINRIPRYLDQRDTTKEIEVISEITDSILQTYWLLFLHSINHKNEYLFDICFEGFEIIDASIPSEQLIERNESLRDEGRLELIDDKRKIENIELSKSKRNVINKIQTDIRTYRLAASAWAFHEYQQGNISNQYFEAIFENVIYPYYNNDLKKLSEIYFGITLRDDQVLDHPRRENVSPTKQTWSLSPAGSSWILEFYSFLGPFIIENQDIQELKNKKETPVESDSSVKIRLNKIQNSLNEHQDKNLFKSWAQKLQVESTNERIDAFLNAHDLAQEQHRTQELEKIRNAETEKEKEREFKQESVNNFISDFELRTVLNEINALNKKKSSGKFEEVSYLDLVPKSQFTTFQSFHMSYDPALIPLILRTYNKFTDRLGPIQQSIQSSENLPTRILDGIEELQPFENGVILVEPATRFGEYLDKEEYNRSIEKQTHPVSGSFYCKGAPVIVDSNLRQSKYSAIILKNIDKITWFEDFKDGSPLRINIVDDLEKKESLLESYGGNNHDFSEGRPYNVVEYKYPFDFNLKNINGFVLKKSDHN